MVCIHSACSRLESSLIVTSCLPAGACRGICCQGSFSSTSHLFSLNLAFAIPSFGVMNIYAKKTQIRFLQPPGEPGFHFRPPQLLHLNFVLNQLSDTTQRGIHL